MNKVFNKLDEDNNSEIHKKIVSENKIEFIV